MASGAAHKFECRRIRRVETWHMYAHVLGSAWRTDRQAFRRLAGDAAGR
jgi:hypothetical protein